MFKGESFRQILMLP